MKIILNVSITVRIFIEIVDKTKKERILMEINAMMSQQLASLQQTLQMTMLDRTMNADAAGVAKLMEQLPQQQAAPAAHPYKGQVIDVQA